VSILNRERERYLIRERMEQEQEQKSVKMEITPNPLMYSPNPNSVDISPGGKTGILYKQVLGEGEGKPFDKNDPYTWLTMKACPGVQVYVHYVGRLADWTEFDRSNRDEEPFSFVLGDGTKMTCGLLDYYDDDAICKFDVTIMTLGTWCAGKVIKAWDIGVEGMLKGEIRRLVVHPDLAYGGTGSGRIPPNSWLFFDIEMIDFEPEDLSKNGDRSILRVKQIPGKNRFLTPIHGSLVDGN